MSDLRERLRKIQALARDSDSPETRRHRTTACANCGRPVGPMAYRPMPSPLTGSRNRYERICVACVEGGK